VGAGILWAYWPTFGELSTRWATDPEYSHGYLVPVFALALLGLRRQQVTPASLRPSWWGIPLLLLGALMYLAGTYYFLTWVYSVSLLPMLVGLAVALGGWKALAWSGPSIAFLLFMIPLPGRLEGMLAAPLQRIATVASTYALQTIGIPALATGNVILLSESELGVVEACSGLRMLVVFIALSVAIGLVIQPSWWRRVLLILSTIPVALIANITRITATGILQETVGSEAAHAVYHDVAGWLMIVLGLVLLSLELRLASRLVVITEPDDEKPAYQVFD
jgi:exosortase